MPFRLEKYAGNPILSPNLQCPWESLSVTNPGAWYDEDTGVVTMLYRCADHDAGYMRRIGLATSRDGCHFERVSDRPVLSPCPDAWDAGPVEDPRIIKMGNWYYVTYVGYPEWQGQVYIPREKRPEIWQWPEYPEEFPDNLKWRGVRTGLALTRDFRTFKRVGPITHPRADDRDLVIFPEKINGKFWRLHRPCWRGPKYGLEAPAMWVGSADDLLWWPEEDTRVMAQAKYPWEGRKIGANTPPIKTPEGWMVLYHGVCPEDRYYRIGAMLLDLQHPGTILHRTPDWIMEPTEAYETAGLYNGVVFPCGAVVIDDTLFVYFGCGDKHVGLATCSLDSLVDHLLTCPA
jgi:beta-1,2-mannobiose phosphorylase / 1,2-beta-oligomannan phosphorylase